MYPIYIVVNAEKYEDIDIILPEKDDIIGLFPLRDNLKALIRLSDEQLIFKVKMEELPTKIILEEFSLETGELTVGYQVSSREIES